MNGDAVRNLEFGVGVSGVWIWIWVWVWIRIKDLDDWMNK